MEDVVYDVIATQVAAPEKKHIRSEGALYALVVLGALLLGGGWGGLAGALGLTLADLTSGYVTSAPKTFLLKFMIGLIAGTVAGHFRLKEKSDRKEITLITAFSAICGLGFNVVADPIVGYFYRNYLLGIPQEAAKIIATWVAGATAINAVACVFVSVILYQALYKSFLPRLPKDE